MGDQTDIVALSSLCIGMMNIELNEVESAGDFLFILLLRKYSKQNRIVSSLSK